MKKLVVPLLIACFAAYLIWPYVELWRLEQAVIQEDAQALAALVDLKAVRIAIKRRLNKDLGTTNDVVSNAFVEWIQDGIHRLGDQAVEQLVTLTWVQQQLTARTSVSESRGFLQHVSYAFFDSWKDFLIRIGELDQDPVYLRLTLGDNGWKVSMIYN